MYSREGFASIPGQDLRGRMRWWGLYTQRKPGIDGGRTAVLRDFNDDHPDTPEEMLALYREATDAARAFCVERDLVTMPEGEHCVVADDDSASRCRRRRRAR